MVLLAGGFALGSNVSRSNAAPRSRPPQATQPAPLPTAALINVQPQDQWPVLPNGCEATSLSMLLSSVGHPLAALQVAKEEPHDPTKRVNGPHNTIAYWGNPEVGYVGHNRQRLNGYAIYHKPLVTFLNRLLPGQAVDLTGKPFKDILRYLAQGRAVEVWTTLTFKPTKHWVTWNSPEGPVRATPDEHAVLLVGYDKDQVFINNPNNGDQAEPAAMGPFLASWKQLGSQAITVKLRKGS